MQLFFGAWHRSASKQAKKDKKDQKGQVKNVSFAELPGVEITPAHIGKCIDPGPADLQSMLLAALQNYHGAESDEEAQKYMDELGEIEAKMRTNRS